jgi:hypothetical protein
MIREAPIDPNTGLPEEDVLIRADRFVYIFRSASEELRTRPNWKLVEQLANEVRRLRALDAEKEAKG